MNKLSKFLKFLDNNIIKILLSIFIFLVPLWPKLPIKMINYTYIAIRFEDIYLVVMCLIFAVQLIRKKIKLNKTFLWLFILYWLAVFASVLWGIFIGKTVDFYHLGLLHSLRRVEYMIVFFIASSVVNNKKDFFLFLNLFITSVFIVGLYGLGQKYLGFPAVQTMNPEFAKGYILYLTPEARISSTFAGHYDLASYLIFAIPIILSFYFYFKKNYFYLLIFVLSSIVLVDTSSRISFAAYVLTCLFFLFQIRKYFFTIFVVILTIGLMYFSGDLAKRYLKTFQVKRILVNEKSGSVYINQNITTKELPAGSFYVKLKDQTTETTEQATEAAYVEYFKKQIVLEQANEATSSGEKLNTNEFNSLIASLSANLKAINTVVSDISFATRLQIEWPRAIEAFKKNPILGSGPSSITEATDNDFLRWLGEIGLLGTTLFLIILFSIIKKVYGQINEPVKENLLLSMGFIFGLLALLINAVYIDVFEASKVAYTFWTIAGLYVGYFGIKFTNQKSKGIN
ncbi:MAG: O-antigen ligase family protein [Patescibacteria group bacterium]